MLNLHWLQYEQKSACVCPQQMESFHDVKLIQFVPITHICNLGHQIDLTGLESIIFQLQCMLKGKVHFENGTWVRNEDMFFKELCIYRTG